MMLRGVRRRLDAEIVRRGLASSRTEAQEAVLAGLVTVGGRPATKTSMMVDEAEPVALAAPSIRRFVSRGGDKLDAALDRFGVDVAGRTCLDAGASTGGFTDCLIQRGAARVFAVDVGYGQLAWSLRNDPRVVVMERTNARALDPDSFDESPSLVVADLSFISLATVIPSLAAAAVPDAEYVLLVKPQFESRRQDVGKGGVVRDPEVWRSSIGSAMAACRSAGLTPRALMASPLPGPAGNVEFLLHADAGESGSAGTAEGVGSADVVTPHPGPDIDAAIREGLDLR